MSFRAPPDTLQEQEEEGVESWRAGEKSAKRVQTKRVPDGNHRADGVVVTVLLSKEGEREVTQTQPEGWIFCPRRKLLLEAKGFRSNAQADGRAARAACLPLR